MRTKAVNQTKEKKWVIPGVKLTHKEFIESIKKAEEGPFYNLELRKYAINGGIQRKTCNLFQAICH